MQEEIRTLINKLNECTEAYDKGTPLISDKDWDDMYFKLQSLEKETGIVYPDSPTQSIHFKTVSELQKKEHEYKPMLSLPKTKDVKELETFCFHKGKTIKNKSYWDWFAMFKLDGLSCRLTYMNGVLVGAETRGDGIVGENVLHNAKVIKNIPKNIPCNSKDEVIIVDGEVICKYQDFNAFQDKYKNPRNFAAGSIRLLDASQCANRNLSFVAWDLIQGYEDVDFNFRRFEILDDLGFETVPRVGDAETVQDAIDALDDMSEEHSTYPIDGYVFKFESKAFCEELGRVEHHFNSAMAFKFYDDTYETRLKYIDYDVSRNGILTPVAVFDPIDFDGSIIERASLHNISVMKEILGDTPYAGEKIWVIKSNMIIPQITKADKKDYGDIIAAGGVTVGLGGDYGVLCPICGSLTSIKVSESGVETLYCDNEECPGKLAQQIDHYCGKKGLDIKGISRATIEKLLDWGYINGIIDIYNLEEHQADWKSKPGFGEASVNKILQAVSEAGRHPVLEAFISAIGIPLVGRTVAKEIVKYYPTWDEFRAAVGGDWTEFEGFGPEINRSINTFDYTEADNIAKLLTFKETNSNVIENNSLAGKVIVITGKLKEYKNRDELKSIIIANGGKVTDSITSKTDLLINNDVNSTSAKNKAAKDRGIPIVSELDFMKQYLNVPFIS